jgi:hypothetical protein
VVSFFHFSLIFKLCPNFPLPLYIVLTGLRTILFFFCLKGWGPPKFGPSSTYGLANTTWQYSCYLSKLSCHDAFSSLLKLTLTVTILEQDGSQQDGSTLGMIMNLFILFNFVFATASVFRTPKQPSTLYPLTSNSNTKKALDFPPFKHTYLTYYTYKYCTPTNECKEGIIHPCAYVNVSKRQELNSSMTCCIKSS